MSVLSERSVTAGILAIIAPVVWAWYHEAPNEVLWHERGKVKIWKFDIPWSVTITVAKARPLIERIFGPDPLTSL